MKGIFIFTARLMFSSQHMQRQVTISKVINLIIIILPFLGFTTPTFASTDASGRVVVLDTTTTKKILLYF